jgi:hypothetical protein
MIIFKSEYNTLERCNLNDYSTSTDNSHRTILLNGENNIITNNNINTSAPSVNINYTKTPTLPDCISIVISSSNNNITNNKMGTIDVYLKQTDDEIIFSIKDDCIEYNPIVEIDSQDNEYGFDNISMLNNIADKVDYTRVLGLNSTIITVIKDN